MHHPGKFCNKCFQFFFTQTENISFRDWITVYQGELCTSPPPNGKHRGKAACSLVPRAGVLSRHILCNVRRTNMAAIFQMHLVKIAQLLCVRKSPSTCPILVHARHAYSTFIYLELARVCVCVFSYDLLCMVSVSERAAPRRERSRGRSERESLDREKIVHGALTSPFCRTSPNAEGYQD